MTIKELYKKIGGDYEDMFARIPSDELIASFVKQFPSDKTYEKLMEAVNTKDRKASFEAAHNLKGLASNLSFSRLFRAVSVLTEQLRPQTEFADLSLVQKVGEQYDATIQAIECREDDRRLQ